MYNNRRMSFIPGEGTEIASIASLNGSGVSITTLADVDYLSANLVAGTNITLVPSPSSTAITINASGGGGGIASVSSAVGSGIEATTVGSGVNLTSALVAGTGIQLVPSGVNKNLTINNTQSITSAIGSGITATTAGGSTALTANLTAGNGIAITPSGANTSKQISNSGVLSIASANAGIVVSQATGAVQLTNNGVLDLTAGAGIAITGTKANYTISATNSADVLSVGAGTAISITGTAQNPIVNNTGVVAINSGTGISVSSATGSPTIALQNVGTAGTYTHPTSITTDAQGRVVSAVIGTSPVVSVSGGTGISITGTATAPIVNNSGLLGLTSANAGTNITITGSATAPIISASSIPASIANTPLGMTWSDTNQSVNGDQVSQIETSFPLITPTTWSTNKAFCLVQLSVSMTQTLNTIGALPTAVIETITFSLGNITYQNDPTTPISITNNTGMTTNGQTYTNTYTAYFVAPVGSATSGLLFASINATNNITNGLSYTQYVANVNSGVKGWATIIPLS